MYKIITLLSVLSFVCLSVVICDDADCEWEGLKGKCVNPRRCLTTLDTRSSTQPPVCSQKDQETMICCTDCELVNDTSNAVVSPSGGFFWKDGRKARDHCLQYLKDLPHKCSQEGYYGGISRQLKTDKCYSFSIWGVGGAPPIGAEPPSPKPYEALMGFGQDLESAIWMTAGAIVSEKFIITSATGHKTTSGRLPLKYVALGVKNRQDDKKNWQIHIVKKIHRHPLYDDSTQYDDIALLELETAITFDTDVLPACLAESDDKFDVTTAQYISWKNSSMGFGTFLDTYHVVKVEVILTAEECTANLTAAETALAAFKIFLPKNVNGTTQSCYFNKEKTLNTLGSPIVVNKHLSRCMNTVIGVTAYSTDGGPTVYTRVEYYMPWIESIVWPGE